MPTRRAFLVGSAVAGLALIAAPRDVLARPAVETRPGGPPPHWFCETPTVLWIEAPAEMVAVAERFIAAHWPASRVRPSVRHRPGPVVLHGVTAGHAWRAFHLNGTWQCEERACTAEHVTHGTADARWVGSTR